MQSSFLCCPSYGQDNNITHFFVTNRYDFTCNFVYKLSLGTSKLTTSSKPFHSTPPSMRLGFDILLSLRGFINFTYLVTHYMLLTTCWPCNFSICETKKVSVTMNHINRSSAERTKKKLHIISSMLEVRSTLMEHVEMR